MSELVTPRTTVLHGNSVLNECNLTVAPQSLVSFGVLVPRGSAKRLVRGSAVVKISTAQTHKRRGAPKFF